MVFGWALTGENNVAVQSDMLNDFDFDSNGDIYAVGTFSHTEEFGETIVTSLASHDGYIVKISEEGEWGAVKTFSSSYDFSLEKVSVNNVGNIAIAGHFADSTMECDDLSISNEDDNGGSMDIFVAVLDSNFNCLWLNSIGGENNDVVKELIFNDDGTVLMGGMVQDIVYFGTQGTDGTAEDGFVCKFTNQGDINWGHRINGINDQSVNTILENSDGTILVGGDSDNKAEIDGGGDNKSSNQAGYILKLDSSANIISLEPIPGVVIEIAKNPTNSDIFIAGTFSGTKSFGDISTTSMGYRDVYVSKYIYPDDFSNFNQASSSDVVDLYSLSFTPSGHILVAGSWGKLFDDYGLELGTLSIDSSDYIDAFVATLDPYGDWTWAIRGTSDRDDIAKKAVIDSKGSLIIGGTFAISHENEVENAVPDGLSFLDSTLEPSSRQSHMYVWKLLVDTDMDGIGSMLDDCEGGQTGWTSIPANDRDSDGCRDSDEDLDDDNDGIADVLAMPCEEALEFFSAQPPIARHMQTLVDVGLGYIRLGQPATTLSGGEAQRVKLASELAKRPTGHTIYILDEPTTGLHFEDIRRLLGVLNRLVDQGNTVVVIEHNLDVIKTADWIVDMGPEGGDHGGKIIAEGTPEHIAKQKVSHTGKFLKEILTS